MIPRAIVWCALAALPAAGQEDRAARELVERLTDDSIEERQKAAAALAEMGAKVVPLVEALSSSTDPELRSRARSILRAIAQNELLRKFYRPGPRLTLDWRDVPVAQALADLGRRSGDEFVFDPGAFGNDRVTVSADGLSAWEALGRLCEEAPALTYAVEGDALSFARERRPPFPVRREGEFQVWVDSILFTRDYDFSGTVREAFVIGLNTAWERGIRPAAVEQRIAAALDEKGEPLPQIQRGVVLARSDAPRGRLKREEFRYMLPAGAAAPQRVSRIRGSVTLSFPLAFEEAVLPFDSPAPMTRVAGATVAVRNLRQVPGSCSFDLVMTLSRTDLDGAPDRISSQGVFVVDDRGAEHPVSQSRRGASYGGQSVTLTEGMTAALPEGRAAAKLRLRILKEVLEKRIDFDFADLPGD